MTPARRNRPDSSRFLRGLLAALLGLAAVSARALDSAEWKYQQTFTLPAAGVTKIALPPETLDRARPGQPDVRLLGPGGEELACLIETPATPQPAHTAPKTFQVRQRRFATELTIETGTTAPLRELELLTPARAFAKAATLETSADGVTWERRIEGVQLSPDRTTRAALLPLGGLVAAHLRITLDDWRNDAVPFTGARLLIAPADTLGSVPVTIARTQRAEFAEDTVLTLDLGGRHLPLAAAIIAADDPLFSRHVTITQRVLERGESVEQTLGTGIVSRSRGTDAPVEALRVPITSPTLARELQVRIANAGSPPLAHLRVSLLRRPTWLIFHAPAAGTYTLLTGHAHVTAPRYDLTALAAALRDLPETALTLPPPIENPRYVRRDVLVNAPLFGAAIDTTAWRFQRQVTPSTAPVQQLELDPVVLAHARADLGDLRLTRDGRQSPYLLERTALRRTLRLEPRTTDDPQQPRLSRWHLTLPHPALPVDTLALESSTPLFDREVRVFELTTDTRGESQARPLVPTQRWRRAPDQPAAALTLALPHRLESATLLLEIDNGDNPPIALEAVDAAYRVTRLLFRSDGQPLTLHYGNANASAPRYDLELLAEPLLREEQGAAALDAVPAEGATSASFLARSGFLFWTALAIVVLALLFVIHRLLPHPPAGDNPP